MTIRIIPILTKRQPFAPLLGISTNKATQVALNLLVHSLSLTVRLWVVRRTHLQLNTSTLENLLPEVASENLIPIRDQGQRHAMQLVDSIHENVSNLSCSIRMTEGNKVSILCERIHKDNDGISRT